MLGRVCRFVLLLLCAICTTVLAQESTSKETGAVSTTTSAQATPTEAPSNGTTEGCADTGSCSHCAPSGPCAPCTDYDKRTLAVCKHTGYKQSISCPPPRPNTPKAPTEMSCVFVQPATQRQVVLFEAANLCLFVLSAGVVVWRQRQLSSRMYWKIQRQIGSTL